MIKIRQEFLDDSLVDVPQTVKQELQTAQISRAIKEGEDIGITVGSRGITDLSQILKVIVDEILKMKAKPFFIPAMGSHGGAEASTQARIVREMVGKDLSHVPIIATMDVEKIGDASGMPVYFSSDALKLDKIIVVNRVKPHTDFRGAIGSGLLKMLVIGLGKYRGAEACHAAARRLGLERVIMEASQIILKAAPIVFGLAIIENAYGKTANVSAVTDRFQHFEEVMFAKADAHMPKLPFDHIDILIIDKIGKEISGNGMDTNIVSRSLYRHEGASAIDLIFVRDLSALTMGNAIGIGLADAITMKLKDKIDRQATTVNCVTSFSLSLGKTPLAFDNDFIALSTLAKITGKAANELRIVWISDTSHLDTCVVSKAYREEIDRSNGIRIIAKSVEMLFDDEGYLINGFD